MNGELSTMTSQMLAILPTQGSPLQGFNENFRIHKVLLNGLSDFAQTFTVYPCFSSSTESSLMSWLGCPLILVITQELCRFNFKLDSYAY